MNICEYGCGQAAKYQFKNGKWCCSNFTTMCLSMKVKNRELNLGKEGFWKGKKFNIEVKNKMSESHKGKISYRKGIKLSEETKKKISISSKGRISWNKGKTGIYSIEAKLQIARKKKITIDQINERYSFFSLIEEIRYNPNKIEEKEIQVHCKNHLCKNSKEQGGWFTPTGNQLSERIRALEKPYGMIENNFYCSIECKNICPLYRDHGKDLLNKNKNLSYTPEEYQIFRQHVLDHDDYTCQFCGKEAEHVHHERPQKLEPFFALDPDYAWSCCQKCHYEKGHRDECSTGNLANKVCF
jgi:hypothetical protein